MYTLETKSRVLNQYQNGAALSDLARDHHISKSTLYSWVSDAFASEVLTAGLTVKQLFVLRCEQIRLQQYNEIYSSTGITALSPIGDRLLTIDKLIDKYSLNVLTDALHVRKSTYYSHRKAQASITEHDLSDDYFKQVISEEFNLARGRFGARKIHVKLSQRCIVVGENRISS